MVYPNIEELIETYFADNKDNLSKRLELLGVKGMGTAVQEFVDKKQKRSVIKMVDQQFKKTVEKLNTMEIDSEETFDEALGQYRESRTAKQEEKEALEILSNVKDDEVDMEIVRPTRGSDCSDIEEMGKTYSVYKDKTSPHHYNVQFHENIDNYFRKNAPVDTILIIFAFFSYRCRG